MLPSFKNNTLSANDFIKSISCDTTTIVVVLESSFNNEIKSKLDFNCKLYNVIHPSVFGRYIKYQIPNNYFKHLEEMKIEH